MSEQDYPRIAITTNDVQAPSITPIGAVVHQFSNERPALLRLGLRNKTDRRVEINSAPPIPFPGFLNDGDDPQRMYLVREDEKGLLHNKEGGPVIPDAPEDGCWRIAAAAATGQALVGFYLNSGETNQTEYVVLAPPTPSECLPSGDYHFTEKVHVDEIGNTFDWNLTVTIR